jgi:hypothetical protein
MLSPYDITGLTGNLYYQVCVNEASDYDDIYDELTTTMSAPPRSLKVPSREVELTHRKKHSSTRSVFLLSEAEAIALREDSRIKYVVLDEAAYAEGSLSAYWPPPTFDEYRNKKGVKIYRDVLGDDEPPDGDDWTNPALSAELDRTNYGVYRPISVDSPWGYNGNQINDIGLKDQKITLDGSGIDLIVHDDGCWFSHTEFVNPTTGRSKVRSVELDGPYYIDPDYFESIGQIRTRWDGLRTCREHNGRLWWSSTADRSAKFANIGKVTALGTNMSYANYWGEAASGTNSYGELAGSHGTPCSSLAYGRTLSNAPGANAWAMHYNANGTEKSMDMMKIFHLNKPKDKEGNQTPTIISTSWGYTLDIPDNTTYDVYWGYDGNRDGTSASETGSYGNYVDRPNFLKSTQTNSNRQYHYDIRNNNPGLHEAGSELVVTPGVFWFTAAGNDHQMIVPYGHPFYWNYYNTKENDYPNRGDRSLTSYVNFGGFPGRAGTDLYDSKKWTFSVGALAMYGKYIGGSPAYAEARATYSNSGPSVPFYAPADNILAASYRPANSILRFPRADTYEGGYEISNEYGYCDKKFGGTSAACPVAAGFFACIIQMLWSGNKNLTENDVKVWIKRNMPDLPGTKLYNPTFDPANADDEDWLVSQTLYTGPPKIIYGPIFNNDKASISGVNLSSITWSK